MITNQGILSSSSRWLNSMYASSSHRRLSWWFDSHFQLWKSILVRIIHASFMHRRCFHYFLPATLRSMASVPECAACLWIVGTHMINNECITRGSNDAQNIFLPLCNATMIWGTIHTTLRHHKNVKLSPCHHWFLHHWHCWIFSHVA